jgi:hypothetical protein
MALDVKQLATAGSFFSFDAMALDAKHLTPVALFFPSSPG